MDENGVPRLQLVADTSTMNALVPWRENARLIAAAPDLLAALLFVAEEFNSSKLRDSWLHKKVQDAIAKATGGAA